MKKLVWILLLLSSLSLMAATKEAGSKTSSKELHALALATRQLTTSRYNLTVCEVELDTNSKGKDVIMVYVYHNGDERVIKTIPRQIGGVPTEIEVVAVTVYYINARGHMVIP